MKRYLLSTTGLIFLLFWPIQAQEIITHNEAGEREHSSIPIRLNTTSETGYLKQLTRRGFRLETQGLLIESLDSSNVYAELNSNTAFNPASVIKIATSFAALSKFGPEYRFQTSILAVGPVNKKTRTLNGDLILLSTGDPVLNSMDVNRLVRDVIRSGITRVTGKLIITGKFTYGPSWTTDRAMKRLDQTFRRLGVRVSSAIRGEASAGGSQLTTHDSVSLRDILFYQNAHSINPTAERLGEALGGPNAIEEFLTKQIGVPQDEVSISHTSGLAYNRITPRGTVQLLRELVYWLNLQNMEPQDILPVAGIDVGTLRRRFSSLEYRGGIIGKTGTLPGTDGGVSTLAGILYTRDRGPILFAIFNSKGSVTTYRRLQDDFLKKFIIECGGIPEVNASLHRLNN